TFRLKVSSCPVLSTLSLHDALPILSVVGGYVQFTSGAPNFFLNRLDLLNAADGTPGTVNLSDVTGGSLHFVNPGAAINIGPGSRSEEHTSELQSQSNLVCRLLLEKK